MATQHIFRRFKSFPAHAKPSLVGWLMRPFVVERVMHNLSSGTDSIEKRLFGDEQTLALVASARDLAEKMDKNAIEYAIIGGFALNVHGFKRQTDDIDVLVTKEGLDLFQQKIRYKGFVPRFPGSKRSYRDARSNVGIDFVVTGEYPGDGTPKCGIAFPEPRSISENISGVNVICLQSLIDLKLASYLSIGQSRMRDRTDVAGLVKHLNLDVDFAAQLSPPVKQEFLEIVQEVQHELSIKI